MLDPAVAKSQSVPLTSGQAMALLAAGAAHELNNPLAVIIGYLSLILSGKTAPEKVFDQLQKVQIEAMHCRAVLDGLSQLADALGGETELLDLSVLLREAIAEVRTISPGLHISFNSEERLFIDGREQGLSQLLRHLLNNSAESSARSLRLETSVEAGWLRLELSDDGAGLDPEHATRVKEPFFSSKAGQLGLGLSICEVVATAHGGSISLSSTHGRGATAVVRLPLALRTPEAAV